MVLNEKVKNCIDKSVLCWLATAETDGTPNVSPKEIFQHYGTNRIIIANIASPKTVHNIRENSKVCVSLIELFVQKGYQLKGSATIIESYHPEFLAMEKSLLEMTKGLFPFKSITCVTVEAVKPIIAPSYVFFSKTNEEAQIRSAKKAYGVE